MLSIEERLQKLESELALVKGATASLSQRIDSPSPRGLTRQQTQDIVDTAVSGIPGASNSGITFVTPTAIDSDTATKAWTTYDASSVIPRGSTIAWVWGHIEVGSNGDQGAIDVSTNGGVDSTYRRLKTATCQSNTDTDSNSGLFPVPLTSDRKFDYQVTGTLSGTDSAWELELQGYS